MIKLNIENAGKVQPNQIWQDHSDRPRDYKYNQTI